MCGIVGAVAQRDVAEILVEAYAAWNTVVTTLRAWQLLTLKQT